MKKSLLVLLFISTVCFAQTPCSGGFANGYPCDGITLQDYISSAAMGAVEAQDSWGWTDPSTNKEYAIVALDNGTAFVDISNPTDIKYLGRMDSYTGSSYWRDVKVYNNHAYIVSDSNGSCIIDAFLLTWNGIKMMTSIKAMIGEAPKLVYRMISTVRDSGRGVGISGESLVK